jgi:hypothetical protein
MSYDLMVFEPEAAPREHAAFMAWYFELTKWNDGPYDDPGRSSHRLRAWITEMQRTFPDMNSLEAADLLDDDGVLSDYTIGREFCYVSFAWSKAVAAAGEAERLAGLHGVGFFDVSSDGEAVYLPVGGKLEIAHRKRPPSMLERLRKKLGGG